ncbi:MAG: DNA polymerase/3'-5' exonuclease PolX [Candidatus Aminicenantales bacterium]
MKNKEIASLFERIADALEIKGESGFKIVAYRKAARILDDLTEDVAAAAAEGRLETLPGIGSGIAAKIREYLATGGMSKFREATEGLPDSLFEILGIQGVGAKTVHLLRSELGVENIGDLKRVIADGRLAAVKGMGKKKAANIRQGIEAHERVQERIPVCDAAAAADAVIDYLKDSAGIGRVAAAGSLRRLKETVGDIDILASGKNGAAIIRRLAAFPKVVRVLAEGETKGSVVIKTGGGERQIDLRIVAEAEYGAALLYFTGSKAHNIKLRGMAKDRGLKISEYGVFKGTKRIAGREEADVYKVLGMPWIPPEMREDRGEIEIAVEGRLPKIIDQSDLRGDLHVHTSESDGSFSLEELADRARKLGYAYVAVCDHSQSVKYARGLSPERLEKQMASIDRLNRTFKGFRILKGTEADILADGSLDFPDELLRKLDFVVASVHSGFRKNVTERMIRAMDNPWLSTIGHPTGRLLSGREGYDVDIDRVIEAAREKGKALELNSTCDRLDLGEFHLKKAREMGVKITIGTDTHKPGGMEMMRFGIGVARRAWLGTKDVLNCLTAEALLKTLRPVSPS